jgi:hypothetical protein
MIYIKLRSVNVPATLTNKRSPIAKVLVDEVIKKYVGGKFLGLNFFPEVSYRYKKNNM